MDKGKGTGSEFIMAQSDSAELFELEKEGFHKVAFLVEPPIDGPRVGFVRSGQDREVRVIVGDKLTERPLAVSSGSKDGRAFEVNLGNQFLGNSTAIG